MRQVNSVTNISTIFKLSPLATLVVMLLNSPSLRAEDYFSPDFIETRGNMSRDIDISSFSKSGGQSPGIYHVEVYLNDTRVEVRDIRFVDNDGNLRPELTKGDFIKWGVKASAQPALMKMNETDQILDLSAVLPGSQTAFKFENMRLEISVPQEFVQRTAQGTVPPEEWDDGVNMMFLNYNFSGASAKGNTGNTNNSFLNLHSGINVGPWRLRNNSTYSNNDRGNEWNILSTSLQRDVKTLKSQLSIGDNYTQSAVFDSFGMRGVQLWSDDGMLPESLRGFAPVVRGIAQGNAQVTIRQSGNIIWQSYVPPGPFAIDDLYPTASSGDLVVTVREADGSERQFIQPFSAVPIMQREGQFKYALAAGKYRTLNSNQQEPNFVQATASYGLPWASTLYGGTIYSKDYFSGALGVGKGFGDFGSLSFDTTWARTQLPNKTDQGISLRVQYAKDVALTDTTFTLMGYRYSTSGFRDFKEANGDINESYFPNREEPDSPADWRYLRNKRSKTQVNINQRLGDWGNLNLSAYQQDYWGGDIERSINLGYNTSIEGINYGLNYSYSRTPWYSDNDRVLSLSVQIPFSRFLPNSWLNASGSVNKKGDATSLVGLSGTALADNNLSWSVQQGYNSQGANVMGNAAANYKGKSGEYQLGYNYSRGNQQVSVGAMGGVVVHPYGVSLTQPLGETMALVKADHTSDVKVLNNTGIYTNNKGYAVVPSITPYRKNTLTLDTASLGQNTDILNDSRTVVPTKGALTLADYPTVTGYKLMLQLQNAAIPFGATASLMNKETAVAGIVDDRARVWLSGAPEQGVVTVRWENGSCQAAYQINNPADPIANITAVCR